MAMINHGGVGQKQADAYTAGNYESGLNQANEPIVAPRTVASAIGRIDGLNERLQGIRSQLANVSDMIGGPRNIAGNQKASAAPSPSGAVHRLNDSADNGHSVVSDIEDLLSSIQRSLG